MKEPYEIFFLLAEEALGPEEAQIERTIDVLLFSPSLEPVFGRFGYVLLHLVGVIAQCGKRGRMALQRYTIFI